jgi:Bax protein
MTKSRNRVRGPWPDRLAQRVLWLKANLIIDHDTQIISCGVIAATAVLALLFTPQPSVSPSLEASTASEGITRTAKFTRTPNRVVANIAKPAGVVVVPGSASKLYQDFRRIGYKLEDVRVGTESVPRVFVKAIPSDIRRINSISTRKAVFIKTMLPLILQVNEELRTTRSRIAAMVARPDPSARLSEDASAWLFEQLRLHGLKPGDEKQLLDRVDIIPPSLALAQAAVESGWGTSRFAIEGRALFGQRTLPSVDGLAADGDESGTVWVKSFDHLLDAVRSYARNLNTHRAYGKFRALRAAMRSQRSLDPLSLVEALDRYSERGEDYTETIKSIIRFNSLLQFDGARLG